MGYSLTGGRVCGAIRYQCSAEPIFAGHCYCRDCQRKSGTAFSSRLVVLADAVKIKGEPRYYEVTADSGKMRKLGFCAICGSPLFSKSEAMPNTIGIMGTSLDDPNLFRPGVSIFTSSAPAWAIFADELPKFPKMPG